MEYLGVIKVFFMAMYDFRTRMSLKIVTGEKNNEQINADI